VELEPVSHLILVPCKAGRRVPLASARVGRQCLALGRVAASVWLLPPVAAQSAALASLDSITRS
jgi:hypothetical protein